MKVLLALFVLARVAAADPSAQLRDANAAATAGDWNQVSALVDPLITASLSPGELAEAHRLYGLAAFFQGRLPEAEAHFLAYLRTDLDGNLDPQLYPPEAIQFFIEVRTKYAAQLRALRPHKNRYMILNVVPAAGQFQNGEFGKGIAIGSLVTVFAVANVASYFVLRSWCSHVNGDAGSSVTCDGSAHHISSAKTLSAINIASGIGLIVTYVYGVYDGVSGYRRKEHEVQPYASLADHANVVGVMGHF